ETTVVGSVFADPSTRSGVWGGFLDFLGSSAVYPVSTDPTTWNSNLSLGANDYGIRLNQLFVSSAFATLSGSDHQDQNALSPAGGIRYTDQTCAGGTPDRPC